MNDTTFYLGAALIAVGMWFLCAEHHEQAAHTFIAAGVLTWSMSNLIAAIAEGPP